MRCTRERARITKNVLRICTLFRTHFLSFALHTSEAFLHALHESPAEHVLQAERHGLQVGMCWLPSVGTPQCAPVVAKSLP